MLSVEIFKKKTKQKLMRLTSMHSLGFEYFTDDWFSLSNASAYVEH